MSNGPIDNLLRLQDVDLRLRAIEREMKDIPARKALEERRLDENKKAVAEADEAQKRVQAKIKELEIEAETLRERIRKLRQQQVDLKTNTEFAAIETEVKSAQKGIGELEDRELDLMSELESARALLAERKTALARQEELVRKDIMVWEERLGVLSQELNTVRAERAEAAKLVPDTAWLKQYEIVFSRRDRAIVQLESGVCGGCHLQLPPYVIHEVRRKNMMVTCSFCGRMLY